MELSTLDQELELLRQKEASAEAQIQYLVSRDGAEPLGRPTELNRSPLRDTLEGVLASMEEVSPRVRAQQFIVDTRAVSIERSKKDYRPDFGVNFQWQHTGSNFPDYYMATAEVTLPVYFWRKQRLAVEEAQARLREAREDYRSTRQQTVFLVKDQYLVAKTSERLLDLYQSGTIPQATLALESTTSAYEVGRVDFLTLLSSLTNVLSLERRYYEELARHEQALARLEPLIGRDLVQP